MIDGIVRLLGQVEDDIDGRPTVKSMLPPSTPFDDHRLPDHAGSHERVAGDGSGATFG